MRRRVRRGRSEAEDLNCAIIACGRKVLVRGVEGDAFDVALVHRESLELLEGVARPDDDFRVEADGDEDRGVVGPC